MKKIKNLSSNRAITLIALIITIIVMLVLVAVSISVLVESDLIGAAEKTGDKFKSEQEKEQTLGQITIGNKTYASIGDYINNNPISDEEEGEQETPGATFSDGTTLTWEELKLAENGTKYGYKATAITDESIDAYAFDGCSGLTSITIPDSVTSIATGYFDAAFAWCSGLTSIKVDSNNPTYHSSGNCIINTASKRLEVGCNNSTIPSDGSVTRIGDFAFTGCTGLTSIIIPNSVEYIGNYCFASCKGLTSVVIPNSLVSIADNSFGSCTGLTSITIPEGVEKIDVYAFAGCKGLTSVVIPNSVTNIAAFAFTGCTGLTSITIPEGVEVIDMCAFEDCTNLTNVTFEDTSTWNLEDDSVVAEDSLSDSSTAATYLTETYVEEMWSKS